jgi:hypothetical protein
MVARPTRVARLTFPSFLGGVLAKTFWLYEMFDLKGGNYEAEVAD